MNNRQIESRIASLNVSKKRMLDYMLLKIEEEDWHGVEDSASDIRDIEAEIKGIEWVYEKNLNNE